MISVIRPFHSVLLANTLVRDRHTVTLYSAAPRKYFKGLAEDVHTRIVPIPLEIVSRLSGGRIPVNIMLHDATFFDKGVSLMMGAPDAYIGWASLSLYSGIAAKRKGARYILDRACPHFDFQQDLVREESAKIGTVFTESPEWYRERVLREYEEADVILVPSEYTARSFQGHLRDKVVKAPLIGRCHIPETVHQKRNDVFTVGIVGGEPRRKGYLYLLRAWKKLALPNAKLLIRSSADFSKHPALDQLIKEMPNVEVVRYVPNISDFYQRCDAFVLSSVDDGFGMALFEAMVNGVPCIVTRNCGASELLTNGDDALIIDARSDEQIAESLLRLYENEDERQSIAARGRQTALYIANGPGAHMYAEAVREMLAIDPSHAALPLSSRSA